MVSGEKSGFSHGEGSVLVKGLPVQQGDAEVQWHIHTIRRAAPDQIDP